MMGQDRAFKREDVVRFLRHALCRVPGKLLVIWDGSPIHRGQAVRDFLSSDPASERQIFRQFAISREANRDKGWGCYNPTPSMRAPFSALRR
jgi:hypothetical protein